MKPVKALLSLSFILTPTLLIASTTKPKLPPIQAIKYYDHEDAYTEILDWEAQTGAKVDMNINICIDDLGCKLFFHKEDGNYNYGTINLAKTTKVSKKGAGIQPILNAIGKGVSAGARVKLKGLKVNPDGSYSIDELEMWAGAGLGTDAPIPGEEDGKQVHHK